MKKLSTFLVALFLAIQLISSTALQAASTDPQRRSVPVKPGIVYFPLLTGDLFRAGLFGQFAPASAYPVRLVSRLPLNAREDYLRRSKRQKTTAWILLGTGIALMVSGFIAASAQDEGVDAGIALIFITGPGIISSLVSIPFFIASARNKRKAMNVSPAIGLQRSPVLPSATGYRAYPAVGIAVKF
jgi:hypothetical protein